jgi:hypothetical protein
LTAAEVLRDYAEWTKYRSALEQMENGAVVCVHCRAVLEADENFGGGPDRPTETSWVSSEGSAWCPEGDVHLPDGEIDPEDWQESDDQAVELLRRAIDVLRDGP